MRWGETKGAGEREKLQGLGGGINAAAKSSNDKGVLIMNCKDKRSIINKIALFILLLSAAFGYFMPAEAASRAAKPIQNRPEGWNGIGWNDGPEKLGTGRRFIRDVPGVGALYIVTGETASFGRAEVGVIQYYFDDDKLIEIDFICSKADEKELLKYAAERFGRPNFVGADEHDYTWMDDVFCVYVKLAPNQESSAVMRYLFEGTSLTNTNSPVFRRKDIPNKQILMDAFDASNKSELEPTPRPRLLPKGRPNLKIISYTKKNEAQYFDGLEIKEVVYYFSQSKLSLVEVSFADTVSNERLREHLVKFFGWPNYISSDELMYNWNDGSEADIADIFVDFFEDGSGGRLRFGNINNWM